MPRSIAEKLRIKEGNTILTLNAPGNFKQVLGAPKGVKIDPKAKEYDQVHWFVQNKSQMEKELGKVMKLLKPGVIIWIYYPKGSSGVQTDLTRDKGWDSLLKKGDELTWISLISFDDTWSTFGLRTKTEADKKKDTKAPATREIFNWVDPVKKEVKLPSDLATALEKFKRASAFFESLSFTNKKEYIEWIVTAKRAETREERVKASIEKLAKGWKNPRNL